MSIEPRWRLALAVGASVLIARLDSLLVLSVLLWAGLVLLGARLAAARRAVGRDAAHDELRTACRRLVGVNAFVLMIWFVLPWSWDGGGLSWDPAGIAQATRLSLRINAIAVFCTALLSGLDAFGIARAASGLGLPPRLSRLLWLTVRYLGVLDETRRRIDRAMRARGFRATASARTFVVIAHQVALVLVHAIVRAERVDMALRARGWSASADARAGRGDRG
ncbi:MAG: energy-coupling factor transporter transmembrane component T [Burkholderiaceae bacterium]